MVGFLLHIHTWGPWVEFLSPDPSPSCSGISRKVYLLLVSLAIKSINKNVKEKQKVPAFPFPVVSEGFSAGSAGVSF